MGTNDTHINIKSWHLWASFVVLVAGVLLTTGGAYNDIKRTAESNTERIGKIEDTVLDIQISVTQIRSDTGNMNKNVQELMDVLKRAVPK